MTWGNKIKLALSFTFDKPKQYRIAVITFVTVFLVDLILLPASSTGGQISFSNLNFLTPQIIAFSLIVAGLLALIVPMTLKLKANGQRTHKASTIIGTIGSFIASLLCCSPILPSIVAFISLILPNVTWLTGIQGYIATHESQILFIALALLIYAFGMSVQQITHCPNCINKSI